MVPNRDQDEIVRLLYRMTCFVGGVSVILSEAKDLSERS
jgi:hypothetical protein